MIDGRRWRSTASRQPPGNTGDRQHLSPAIIAGDEAQGGPRTNIVPRFQQRAPVVAEDVGPVARRKSSYRDGCSTQRCGGKTRRVNVVVAVVASGNAGRPPELRLPA